MIDACSYKLWMKDKMEEEEIAQCGINLRNMLDLLETKAEEIVDIVAVNQEYASKIKEIKEFVNQKRDKLAMAKINLLNSRRRVSQFNAF